MASGPHQQQSQHPQHHQQPLEQRQPHHMQHPQSHQMQFSPNHVAGLSSAQFDNQQQSQQMHQHNTTMPPNSEPMSVNHAPVGHIMTISSHQQQQIMGTNMNAQSPGNQSTSHIQQQQQQKSHILPLLLSPRPPSLTPNSNDQTERSETDHEQIIDQVISLENELSDTSGMLANVDGNAGVMMMHQQEHHHQQQQQQQHHHQQQQQHHLGDINIGGGICLPDNNQFSSSSEDLLNLLLEFDREPTNLIGIDDGQQLDQDEKVGIETIRKQLMSCEVQSEPPLHQNTNSMSPIINQMACQPRATQQQSRNSVHQQQVTQQLISRTAPVNPHHQLQHQISASGLSQQQQQQLSTDQSMLHGSYSNVPMSTVPVSSSGQSYAPQQQQQHVTRISQSNPMSIVNNSPSPSWQQPQLSPYSPQTPHSNSRTPSQRQGQQHHQMSQHAMSQQPHQTATSPQMQQLHHPLQQRSPSQSVSPPVSTEPSPVVKKNPLLNAQLVNSRAPSITPTRFMNSQTNVLNQNPILNAELSQNPFVNNSGSVVSSPVNPNLNPQSRYIQQPQQQSNFNYDITQPQQQQQQNAQQGGPMTIYGTGDQQQQQSQTNQVFRTSTSASSMTTGTGTSITMGNTSPSAGLSQQVKQEIRRKVQQPKQQHQTTSLLKQLLSDDNK